MNTEQLVDKRLHQRAEQVKQQAIYEIYQLMEFHGITWQELKKVETRNYLDELTKIRNKRRYKRERQEALVEARKRRHVETRAKHKAKRDADIQEQKRIQNQKYVRKVKDEKTGKTTIESYKGESSQTTEALN